MRPFKIYIILFILSISTIFLGCRKPTEKSHAVVHTEQAESVGPSSDAQSKETSEEKTCYSNEALSQFERRIVLREAMKHAKDRVKTRKKAWLKAAHICSKVTGVNVIPYQISVEGLESFWHFKTLDKNKNEDR
jgi:hypothetical protein